MFEMKTRKKNAERMDEQAKLSQANDLGYIFYHAGIFFGFDTFS